MYKKIIPLLYFSLILCLAQAQTKLDKRIEKQLDDMLAEKIKPMEPGYVMLISKNGEIMYNKAFGMANMELQVPLQTGMVFNLASITKQFTAVAILQLMEQGKLSLKDSLQQFIPDFPSQEHTITIEHLLTHTSGIKDYLQIDLSAPFAERWDFSPKQLIDSIKNLPLNFEPGTRFSYSNSGYFLLGYIIQQLSGLSYQRYIEQNLLNPLSLQHSYFDSAGIIIPNRVSGYIKDGNAWKNAEYWSPSIEYAAGGLLSSVADLHQWHTALYRYQILKKETLEKAFTTYTLKDGSQTGYGYGWFLKNANGIRSIEHEGGLPGFKTNEIYFPEEDVFIAILSNTGDFPIDEVSIRASGLVLGKSLQTEIKLDGKLLDDYVGEYQLTIDPNRKMTITRINDQLIAQLSEKEIIPILFQTETKFQFKNLLNANCIFIRDNGKVIQFNVEQNGLYIWKKIK